jgi:hypothetical protein
VLVAATHNKYTTREIPRTVLLPQSLQCTAEVF